MFGSFISSHKHQDHSNINNNILIPLKVSDNGLHLEDSLIPHLMPLLLTSPRLKSFKNYVFPSAMMESFQPIS